MRSNPTPIFPSRRVGRAARRPLIWVLLAGSVLGLGTTSAGAQPIISALPDTTSGVHVGAPFLRCYKEMWAASGGTRSGCDASGATTSIKSLNGKVDFGFTWSYGLFSQAQFGGTVNLGAALKVDRFPGYAQQSPRWPAAPVTLSEWQQSHPTWIEYTCAVDSQGRHTTPAWEFGEVPATGASNAFVPFNVNDSAARSFFYNTYVKSSLQNGYRVIMFDNLHMRQNSFGRCGHYDSQGNWVQDYSATNPYDPKWQHDMAIWIEYLRDQIHKYSPDSKLGLNYSPSENGDTAGLYQQVFNIADVIWDEAGFTDWGVARLSGLAWTRHFQAMSYAAALAHHGLFINGISGGHSNRDPNAITADDRQWVLANYLLVKGSHTYFNITPNSYGTFFDFPEYHVAIGSATGAAAQSQGVWMRHFSHGLAIVNPDTSSHTIVVPAGYTNTSGQRVQGNVTLAATTGLTLLN